LPCDIRDVSVTAGPRWSEKTEQRTVTVILQSRLDRSCWIDGYPRVTAFDGSDRRIAFSYRHGGDEMVTRAAPRRVTLPPSGRAYFVLNKTACDLTPSSEAVRLRISLPGSAARADLRLPRFFRRLDYCGPGVFARITASPFVARLDDAARR
jgi:hypothetical protein